MNRGASPRVDRRDLPHATDAGLGEHGRIGAVLLATDQTLEHEFRQVLAALPGTELYTTRVHNEVQISPASLAAMASRLSAAAATLVPQLELDVLAYACTSATMVIGTEAVHRQLALGRTGTTCTTPMEAATRALRALGLRRIAFVPPYVNEINQRMRNCLREDGFEVPVMLSWNLDDDDQVARLDAASVRDAVLEAGSEADVDGVFLACTNVRALDQVSSLEDRLGKPVVSSNTALIWDCLRRAGRQDVVAGAGALLTLPAPV